jgi:hypothetical protein
MLRRNQLMSMLLAGLLLGACSDDNGQKSDNGSTKTDGGGTGACEDTKTCGTTDLLPADNAVGDYAKKGAPRVAADAACLQQLIDGGSVKYEQNKFACVSVVTYASAADSAEIEVWAFDQTDAAGAQAAMDLAAANMTDLGPTLGEASKEDVSLPSTYMAFARKGKTLVRVLANKKTSRDAAINLMSEIIAAAP